MKRLTCAWAGAAVLAAVVVGAGSVAWAVPGDDGGDPEETGMFVPDGVDPAVPNSVLYVVGPGAGDAPVGELGSRYGMTVVTAPASGTLADLREAGPESTAARGLLLVGCAAWDLLAAAPGALTDFASVSVLAAGDEHAAEAVDAVAGADLAVDAPRFLFDPAPFAGVVARASGPDLPGGLRSIRRHSPPASTEEDRLRRWEAHLNFHQAAMVDATPSLSKWPRFTFERIRGFLDENAAAAPASEKPRVCLLGSSTMQGFPADLLPEWEVVNRGIAAERLGIGDRGVSHRLECSVFDVRPDVVFIKNGRNDIGGTARTGEPTVARMLQEYEEIVTRIRRRLPKTLVVIVTCAPVRDRYAHLAELTAEYNRGLVALAARLGVPCIDLHADLVGDDGLLRPEYSRDGLHITRAAMELWAGLMRDVVRERTGEDAR